MIKQRKYKIAFFDRDGTLNSRKYNNGYIGFIKHFKWIKGAIKAIKYLKNKQYKIVVVTNQSGVARGFFKIKDVKYLHAYMQKNLKVKNTKIDGFFFCPYHENGIIKRYKKKSLLRKPEIGMFNLAKQKWRIDKKNSFMIGDKFTDIQFAKRSGIKGFLFKGGRLDLFVKKKIN